MFRLHFSHTVSLPLSLSWMHEGQYLLCTTLGMVCASQKQQHYAVANPFLYQIILSKQATNKIRAKKSKNGGHTHWLSRTKTCFIGNRYTHTHTNQNPTYLTTTALPALKLTPSFSFSVALKTRQNQTHTKVNFSILKGEKHTPDPNRHGLLGRFDVRTNAIQNRRAHTPSPTRRTKSVSGY